MPDGTQLGQTVPIHFRISEQQLDAFVLRAEVFLDAPDEVRLELPGSGPITSAPCVG